MRRPAPKLCAATTPALVEKGPPFRDVLNAAEHMRRVVAGGERPKLPPSVAPAGSAPRGVGSCMAAPPVWPAPLCETLTRCWDRDPTARPTAGEARGSFAVSGVVLGVAPRSFDV